MRQSHPGSRQASRRFSTAVFSALMLACAGTETAGTPTRPADSETPAGTPAAPIVAYPARVVLISVAGMTPDAYRVRGGTAAAMPTVASLGMAGAAADAMTTVTPGARYPAHATLVTGQPPRVHGIVADRQIGELGVRRTPYWHASQLKTPPLWGVATREKRSVASLGWPTTVGASISALISDIFPVSRGDSWFSVVAAASTPELIARIAAADRNDPALAHEGRARDALLTELACGLFRSESPPELTMLLLSQAAPALTAYGPDSAPARAALARADADVRRLLDCLTASGRVDDTAIVIVGDRGVLPVHTLVAPNAVLAGVGLIVPSAGSREAIHSWSALSRANGGTAFIYAKTDEAALIARRVLTAEAARSRSFRIVSAEEMLDHGADPEAWFGLDAEPGFAFGNQIVLPILQPGARRGVGGYLSGRPGTEAGFVAWGRGIRRGVRVPRLRQADVAPTIARLLGIDLGDVEGRPVIGILSTPAAKRPPLASNQTDAR